MVRRAHHERNLPFNRVAEPVLSVVEGFKLFKTIKIGKIDTTLRLYVITNLLTAFSTEPSAQSLSLLSTKTLLHSLLPRFRNSENEEITTVGGIVDDFAGDGSV